MENNAESKQENRLQLHPVPFVVFIIFLVITFGAWDFTNKSVQKQEQVKFESETESLEKSIDDRFSVYETVLYDIRALFSSSISVERSEFISYLGTNQVEKRFPGITAISFAHRVKAADKDAFIQSVKQDTSLVTTGYPFFAIKPSGENKSEYYVSTYTASATSSAVASASAGFGLDLLSIPDRAVALKKAVDINMPVASTIITLLGNPPGRKGFSIYIPVYKNGLPVSSTAQRRDAVLGIISGTFAANNIFGTILSEEKIPNISTAIYDTEETSVLSADNLLYNSNPDVKQNSSSNLIKTTQFSLGERNWTIQFTALPGYGLTATQELLPWYVLTGGIIFSFLLSAALYLIINSRARALSLAEKMTQKLAQSEEGYRKILENLQDVYYRTDNEGKIIYITPSIYKYIGFKPEEMIGRNAGEFYIDPFAREKLVEAMKETGSVSDYSISLKSKDQQAKFVSLTGHLLFDNNKQPTGLEGVLRDVTERLKAEKELQKQHDELEGLNKFMVTRELKMIELKNQIKSQSKE